MSSSTTIKAPAPSPAPAPWRENFGTDLTKSSTKVFALATIAYETPHTSASTSGSNQNKQKQQQIPVPRTRFCGFRGFFPTPNSLSDDVLKDLQVNVLKIPDSDNYSLDPSNVFGMESDMLTFTTDVRMEKMGQIVESGGVVEGVFWLGDLGVQWRIRGVACVIGGKLDEVEEKAREGIWGFLRRTRSGSGTVSGKDEENKTKRYSDWDWEKAVTVYFANHSPVLRGSFKSPPPGHPKSEPPPTPSLKPNQKVSDFNDPVSRENFRVVAIIPREVEKLDVSDYEKGASSSSYGGDGRRGMWEEVELWP